MSPRIALAVLLLATSHLPAATPWPASARPPTHELVTEARIFPMSDGTRIAATIFRPGRRLAGPAPTERFPVLLELLPYRKDDSFARRDWRHHAYFARRGCISVRADVRGTGSSGGRLPDREYSDRELADAEELIARLAALPGSTGRVGMWGISWGGFNAIQTAMRGPPALRAILAVDAADDLFHDDIHFIDGIFHVDAYQLEIDHENGLPRSPDYPVDAAYLADRFNRRPWLLEYLEHQRPGPFWSRNSLRDQYDRLRIPSFLIGGLADGYRDSIPRMLASVKAPVTAWIGPWNHDFPDEGVPGPNHDWRAAALDFWHHWLADEPNGADRWPRLAAFVRAGHAPGELAAAPGRWQVLDWPDRRIAPRRFALAPSRLDDRPGPAATVPLPYRPGSGLAAGDWWGDAPGDMASADAHAATFDGAPLAAPLTVIGQPRVQLVSKTSTLAHTVARLEDVAPDGRVTLVTGAARSGAHSPTPEPLSLHFTTWTFRRGHRIRLALAHGQFPMFWPTPRATTGRLAVGAGGTTLELPIAPATLSPEPAFPPAQDLEERPHSAERGGAVYDDKTWGFDGGRAWYQLRSSYGYEVDGRTYEVAYRLRHTAAPAAPWSAASHGWIRTQIGGNARPLELTTELRVTSDRTQFQVDFTRTLTSRERRLAHRTWHERIPRQGN